MSLGIVIKGPEGIVLAADSRVTLAIQQEIPDGNILIREFHFDNSHKLLHFSEDLKEKHGYVGAVTYGMAVIPGTQRTAHSYFQEFEKTIAHTERMTVLEYANRIGTFYRDLWNEKAPQDYDGPDMLFIVAGFDEGEAYGRVFVVSVPSEIEPHPRNEGDTNFGMTWGGQLTVPSRIIHGIDPEMLVFLAAKYGLDDAGKTALEMELRQHFEYRIPYQVLPLQDCVDLAILLIRTTVGVQSRAAVPRGVGGMIDVATIGRGEPLQFVQQKTLRGDLDHRNRFGG